MHCLFNICYETRGKSIINQIPKTSTTDSRDPLSHRGMSLSYLMYKLYASVLNNRLCEWSESNDIIVSEENNF